MGDSDRRSRIAAGPSAGASQSVPEAPRVILFGVFSVRDAYDAIDGPVIGLLGAMMFWPSAGAAG